MNTIEIKDNPKIKTSQIMQRLRDKFSVWSYYDDQQLDQQFPAPEKETARHFLDSQEPDAETLGLSTKEVSKKHPDGQGITLRERMLLELAYFEKHGEHLDIKGITFCSGSRHSDGFVPYMGWSSDDREVEVSWYSLDVSDAWCGVRSCISIDKEVQLGNENYTDKQGFNITCERCGLCVHIKS